MRFSWDDKKRKTNLHRHGVDFADAVGVFFDDHALTIEDADAKEEQRLVTMGRDYLDRVLLVVYTERGEDEISQPRGTQGVHTRGRAMKAEYDFSKAKRGAVAVEPGKTRVTIRLDDDVLDWYRRQAEKYGGNYQTAINAALREQMSAEDGALERVLRRVIREEMLAS